MARFTGWTNSSILTPDQLSSNEEYNASLYSQQNSTRWSTSFQGTNGLLEEKYNWNQYEASVAVEDNRMSQRIVQPNTVAGGKMVGLTGGADYYCNDAAGAKPRYGAFKGPSSERIHWRIIPGTGLEFFLAERAFVILTWQVGGGNSERFKETQFTKMSLMIDDWLDENPASTGLLAVTGTRHIPQSTFSKGSWGTQPDKMRVRMPHRDRVWSGHYTSTMSKGWHSVGIAAWQKDRALKFRVRNMKAIWFYR